MRGNDILQAAQERHLAERMKQYLNTSCAHCGASWSGTAGEVIEAARQHRLEFHPEAVPTRRAKRKPGSPHTFGARTLDENLVLARAQGGATWVSSEGVA